MLVVGEIEPLKNVLIQQYSDKRFISKSSDIKHLPNNFKLYLCKYVNNAYLFPKFEGSLGTAENDPNSDFGSSSGCCGTAG